MNPCKRLWLIVGYYLSWFMFGLGALLLNLCCTPFLLRSDRERLGPRARAAIQGMFDLWLRWMHATGVIEIFWHGFEQPPPRGTVCVANHPSLLDATFLLARLPDTVCIFKPALLRNPFIAPAALLGGYVSGDAGVDGIRGAARRVASGASLLIFPEGTRTNQGARLNPLHPGFALVARRARAGVQIIRITASPLIAAKGRPWWKLPPLPARFDFVLGPFLPFEENIAPTELCRLVERHLSA